LIPKNKTNAQERGARIAIDKCVVLGYAEPIGGRQCGPFAQALAFDKWEFPFYNAIYEYQSYPG
jgi:hypothetical protein